jgi:hypothetical protein
MLTAFMPKGRNNLNVNLSTGNGIIKHAISTQCCSVKVPQKYCAKLNSQTQKTTYWMIPFI